jgi:predicted DNA-binding protein
MAEAPKTPVRLSPIIRAYLDDLAKIGAYGKGRSGVMRRFIENGIKEAIEKS